MMKVKMIFFLIILLLLSSCISLRTKYAEQVAIAEKIVNDKSYLAQIRNDTNYVNINSRFFRKYEDTSCNESIHNWLKKPYEVILIFETKSCWSTEEEGPDQEYYLKNPDKCHDTVVIFIIGENGFLATFYYFDHGDKYLLEFIDYNADSDKDILRYYNLLKN